MPDDIRDTGNLSVSNSSPEFGEFVRKLFVWVTQRNRQHVRWAHGMGRSVPWAEGFVTLWARSAIVRVASGLGRRDHWEESVDGGFNLRNAHLQIVSRYGYPPSNSSKGACFLCTSHCPSRSLTLVRDRSNPRIGLGDRTVFLYIFRAPNLLGCT